MVTQRYWLSRSEISMRSTDRTDKTPGRLNSEKQKYESMRDAIKEVSHAWNSASPEVRDGITAVELTGLGKIPTKTFDDVERWKNAWLRILKSNRPVT